MSSAIHGPVRVRFAPSPTGFLHVGGARTAIYNDLLRQSAGGAFVLRIEDTDKERSDEAMTRQIQSALAWIGVVWDEGPFLQSARLARHHERAEELLASGKAYRCFCTPAELDAQRDEAQKRGVAFRYPRTCQRLSQPEIDARLAAGQPFAVRFRMPGEPITFTDLVRGEMVFPPEALDDYILLRSDGNPTYHMSVVVDDIDMGITHVVRGEDHLSNTPKHIPLFRALGGAVPTFGHLPLILGPDKKRLSKRYGATSVEEFRKEGILPQALYNFLALLGWNPGDDREIMTREEMIAAFTVERLNASAAVFDREKLWWMNAQYLSRLSVQELWPHLEPFIEQAGLKDADRERLTAALELYRSRARTLKELAELAVIFFQDELAYDPAAAAKFLKDPDLPGHLEALRDRWARLPRFDKEALEAELRSLAGERGLKAGALIHPARLALSAASAGPPLFDLVEVMGRAAADRHLARFVAFLRSAGDLAPARERIPAELRS
jgi:glutamyl-tRNA synthetase